MFEHGWTAKMPIYDHDSGSVGNPIRYSFPFDEGRLQVDPEKWQTLPDRTPLVLAKRGSVRAWARRASLCEPFYEETWSRIEDLGREIDAEMLADTWKKKREEYKEKTAVTLGYDAWGWVHLGDTTVMVKAGEYTVITTLDNARKGAPAPFSILIQVEDKWIEVDPHDVQGSDTSHVDQAKQEGKADRLEAASVLAMFRSGPPFVSRYVPKGVWLQNNRIHYVTAEQMGAVFVLRRMPTGQAQIAHAESKDPDAFREGRSSPGVCVSGHICIRDDQMGTGTELHEAVHLLAHGAVRAVLGWNFNEGVTEYFTREILAAPANKGTAIRNDAQYSAQREAVEFLLTKHVITVEDLAAAYFKGEVGPLFAKVRAATREVKEISLQAYAEHCGRRSYEAQSYLDKILAKVGAG